MKQVQEWLGHADPGFTLRTYVHLMDDGLGDANFLDGAVRVKGGSRSDPQKDPDPDTAAAKKQVSVQSPLRPAPAGDRRGSGR